MPTDKPKALITLTHEINNAINDLVMSDNWKMNKSETIRYAVIKLLQENGYNVSDDMPQHGGNRQARE